MTETLEKPTQEEFQVAARVLEWTRGELEELHEKSSDPLFLDFCSERLTQTHDLIDLIKDQIEDDD